MLIAPDGSEVIALFFHEDGSTTQACIGILEGSPSIISTVTLGTTSDGKSAETTPTNGFWFLSVNKTGTLERWSKLVGLDSSGKVIENFQGIME